MKEQVNFSCTEYDGGSVAFILKLQEKSLEFHC
jgi:hypothetical protein